MFHRRGSEDDPLRALIFDSFYDNYKGVIVHVRVMEGAVKPDDTICLMSTGREFTVTEVGYFRPGQYAPCDGCWQAM